MLGGSRRRALHRIGARTNIQDGSVAPTSMRDEWPLILGDDVTVGHSVTLPVVPRVARLIGMGRGPF